MASDIHDALFKFTFSNPEHAAGELRHVLPPRLASRIDFASLKLCPGSYVDEALLQQHSDLLFSVLFAGRPTLLYLLFEHKSGPEALTAFQLLRYMVRIWETFVREQETPTRLPVILPVVLHHGEGGWTCARSFQELLDVDEEVLAEIAEYIPRMRFFLDDLAKEQDEALRRRAMSALGRLVLWCMRHARSPEAILEGMARWRDLVREVRRAPNGVAALAALWRYALMVGERFGPDNMLERLIEAVGEEGKEEVVTAGEQLIERGRAEGKRRLLKQLQIRFGALPEGVVDRVTEADPTKLDLWAERLLTAPTLEDVLGT